MISVFLPNLPSQGITDAVPTNSLMTETGRYVLLKK